MITKSKEKIEKARELLKLVELRKSVEKAESELKEYFKLEATDGVIEADDVLVVIKKQSRVTLDRDALTAELGDKIKRFEKSTEYSMVLVSRKQAA